MVERVVWDHEAAGSKPVTRTKMAVFTAEKPQGSPLCGFSAHESPVPKDYSLHAKVFEVYLYGRK